MITIISSDGSLTPLDLDDYTLQQEWQGWENTLRFRLPAGHPQRQLIQERTQLEDRDSGQTYSVTLIDEGINSADITAALDLDDLRSTMTIGYSNSSDTAGGTILNVLPRTWTVIDNSGMTFRRTIKLPGASPLDVIQQAVKTYPGLTVQFDNAARSVTLTDPSKVQYSGTYFTDELNLAELPQYKGKAKALYTRLYAQGKDGLTFADINGGKPYVDCNDYTDRVICHYWQDDRYTDAESLKRMAEAMVKAAAVPERSYECCVIDLAQILPNDYSFLNVEMYQVVLLMDRASKKRIQHQVVRYCRHPLHSEKNKVVLSTVPGTVSGKATAAHAAIEDTSGLSDFSQRWQALIGVVADGISGYDGGNYKITYNSAGKPNGFMIMDTDSASTARKVLWFNLKGVLYSEDGVAGFDNPDQSKLTVWSFERNGMAANWAKFGTLDAALVRVINLIADHLRSESEDKTYMLDAWAAVLKLTEAGKLRCRLRTEGDPYGNGIGHLELCAGDVQEAARSIGENGKMTRLSPMEIHVGETSTGELSGSVYTKSIQTQDVLLSGKTALSLIDGCRILQVDKIALGDGVPYTVNWKWIKEVGNYLMVPDRKPTELIYPKSTSVTQAVDPGWNTNYIDVKIPEGITRVILSDYIPAVSFGVCETKITVLRADVVYATLRYSRSAYTGYGQSQSEQISPIVDYTALQTGDVLRLQIWASYNPSVSGAHTSTASVTYELKGISAQ